MGFWDTFAGIGGAVGDATAGFGEGLKPFTAWEGIRGQSTQSDARDIANRAAYLQQQADEGAGYYGAHAFANTTKDQLAGFGSQQSLAYDQSLLTPDIQAELRKYPPGSLEQMTVLARAKQQNTPYDLPAFYKDTLQPAEARSIGQDFGARQIEAQMRNKVDVNGNPVYPDNVYVSFEPGRGYVALDENLNEVAIPPDLQAMPLAAAGFKDPQTAEEISTKSIRDTRIAAANAENNRKKAEQERIQSSPELTHARGMYTQAEREYNNARIEEQKMPFEPDPLVREAKLADIRQRQARAQADMQEWSTKGQAVFDRLSEQRASRGRGAGGGGGAVMGDPTGDPNRAIGWTNPQGEQFNIDPQGLTQRQLEWLQANGAPPQLLSAAAAGRPGRAAPPPLAVDGTGRVVPVAPQPPVDTRQGGGDEGLTPQAEGAIVGGGGQQQPYSINPLTGMPYMPPYTDPYTDPYERSALGVPSWFGLNESLPNPLPAPFNIVNAVTRHFTPQAQYEHSMDLIRNAQYERQMNPPRRR